MTAPRLIDRRSAGNRWLEERWRRWGEGEPIWLTPLAALTEPLQRWILGRRVAGRPDAPDDRLVVSIGNLRVGGTGKTPLVIDTVARLSDAGVKGLVLTRGYGSRRKSPCFVHPHDADCGDEARLIARSGTWPVIQAADRRAGFALALESTLPGQVILVEDAHQSAGVPRHHDILILDRWRDAGGVRIAETGRLLPWGPYREGPAGAERADALVVEGGPGAGDAAAAPESDRPNLAFRRSGVLPAETLTCDAPYAVVSGLARPEGFEEICAAALGRPPVIVARFDDHARFRPADVAALLRSGAEAGAALWLTTGKDHGKLASLWPDGPALHQVGLDLEWEGLTPADLIVDWLTVRT